jgi:hypothetical protein
VPFEKIVERKPIDDQKQKACRSHEQAIRFQQFILSYPVAHDEAGIQLLDEPRWRETANR